MSDPPETIDDAPDEQISAATPTFRSLREAKRDPDGIVILEGDYGGQIYLVCPASLVQCREIDLARLLEDLNVIAWGTSEPGRSIYYDKQPVGMWIDGGMGGGKVTANIWIHDKFEKKGLRSAIEEVIAGRRTRVGG